MKRGKATKAILVVLVLGVLTAPAWGQTQSSNTLSIGGGLGLESVQPEQGGLVEIEYARRLDESLWLIVRPELQLNLAAQDGSPMKSAAVGLDLGLRWMSGEPDQVRFGLGAALGGRGYFWPGYGAALRLDARVVFPLKAALDLVLGCAVELGVAKVGEEYDSVRAVELTTRGDLFLAIAYSY